MNRMDFSEWIPSPVTLVLSFIFVVFLNIYSEFKKRKKGYPKRPFESSQTSKELRTLQYTLTNYALEIAESYGINLDFSNKSVKLVEKILGDIHKEYKKTKKDEGLVGIALEFAAYIITTIEQNFYPGQWKRNHPEFGKDSFPYYWKGATLFPHSWCKKRIFDGKEDDIWAKYKILVIDKADEKHSIVDNFTKKLLRYLS